MNSQLIEKYANKGLFIDANLLLLLLVGATDKNFIPKFKRTAKYLTEDYDILVRFIGLFRKMVLTPNVLTEVSNLADGLYGRYSQLFSTLFAELVKQTDEKYIESRKIVFEQVCLNYGLSDATIIEVVKNQYLLLTDDLKLANYAQSQGIDVINFNHVRTRVWWMNKIQRTK